MAQPDDPDEEATPYRLSDEPPTRPRYIPMKGFRASSERPPDEFDKPVLKRLIGLDPFPWMLATAVGLWILFGIAGRAEPIFAVVLIVLGFLVILAAQIWLYASILLDDLTDGILSLVSGFYRTFYLYSNPELAWRPGLLSFVGFLMMVTGIGVASNLGSR
jgi:hypothetical protein